VKETSKVAKGKLEVSIYVDEQKHLGYSLVTVTVVSTG